MSNPASSNLFARVQNNQIVEWPVTQEHITNRGAPLSMFRSIHYAPKPTVPPFFHLNETISLVHGTPTVAYSITEYTLQEVLDFIAIPKVAGVPNTVADVDPLAFQKVTSMARDLIGKALDDFAKTRGYDNIVSLCSYKDDPDVQQDAEARRGIDLRSQCWVNIRKYEQDVVAGVVPVPRYEADILGVIPVLSWE